MFDYRYLINKTSTMSENEGTIGNLVYSYFILCLIIINLMLGEIVLNPYLLN